ncbi:hypothetical protein [Paraburkholderia aromaticivorans]|uniref:Uncharacterized protein n=1 Tax=Paraburkholderia aromaticivorans TaxID=2026199 RepID=A0A248VYM5_9BURK|nr:hypothetical protein [Paraburkholderia aromaticivorans]ASW04139.1 hypothetical protein CJU94_38915 [Paraburkholderia aromaticivorans]
MSEKSYVHNAITWAKQRLDELDITISELETSSGNLNDSAREEADRALTRLREARTKLNGYVDDLRLETVAAKQRGEVIQKAIDTEWVEVELAFRDFLSAAKDHADTVRNVVLARARAQHQAWETTLKNLHDQAADVVEKARGDLDAAMRHLTDEAQKFQRRIGEVRDAGDESWSAVKSGLTDVKDVHGHVIQKIKNAFSKLR